eukprot:CAMPEP_0180122838 /NCGR_PEP_ID=MMETSP0986-20121125/3796_1 /TAXON_ID=697907 /ORGANISM="non described non described, Strain CCMP2293" /LENGTH=220 /DNA_ID=CAMNT_0022062067 /DNA_START=51 /DNA_END=714 /DNA_ORIENTATION=-
MSQAKEPTARHHSMTASDSLKFTSGSERRSSPSPPTNSSGSPLEMLRLKVRTERMQRVVEARSSVKQCLHDFTAAASFNKLSGSQQAAWLCGASLAPPSLSGCAQTSTENVLLSEGKAEFAACPPFVHKGHLMPQGGELGEVPDMAPEADSNTMKPRRPICPLVASRVGGWGGDGVRLHQPSREDQIVSFKTSDLPGRGVRSDPSIKGKWLQKIVGLVRL